ncbi:Xre family transcriptional regulator [Paraburkholderia tropica]|uniref:helix-turn-helix domain-containing protein n=1 Tax=Paraburkholderia tropica TaxID=92647 RepID=UPI001CB05876|nr:helix-turn-helix domain-containing protein [Paraburkholderia tropica]CAG9229091.1 Xre family transcriptional regulator [Paraburkholderia tropica]
MSEPQHPFGTDGTETHAGRTAQDGAPSPVQAVPDTLGAVGARLAQLREAKGWSIEDVSARLKVAVSKLRELEAGDISHLPDTTFAVGVVRAYAKLLGADPAPLTQALRRERGVPEQDLSMPASAGADLPRGRVSLSLGGGGARAPRRRASWLWGLGIIVIAVIALSMWHTNSGESSAWFARIKSMANGVSASSGASSATVAEGATANGDDAASGAQADDQAAQGGAQTDAQANDQAVAQAPASVPQAAQPASAASAAKAANTAAASAAQVAQAAAAAASAPAVATTAQGASAAAASGDASTFTIRVTQDTWVSVRGKDGKEVFSGLVHGADSRDINAIAPMKITVGNKAGIESMSIDGQPVDAAKYASSRGNVARFVLP